jgi:Kef-type K+ transport system membrane component KefB
MLPAFFLASAAGAENIPLRMLLVFGSAKLLGEILSRIGIPQVVGGILAGIIIGPSALGWVKPDPMLVSLSELGVMFLLFRVGLEVRSDDLIQVGRTAIAVAILGVAVPFALGWLIMHLVGHPAAESLFVGAAMVATSIGITAQVLAAKGLLSHHTARIVLAAAIIDDILGLLVLAVVSSIAQGAINYRGLATTAALAVGFTILILRWGSRTMVRVVPRVEVALQGEGQFTVAMVLLFVLGVLAQYSGVAAIVGAFLAGMALADSVGHRVHDFATGITELLTPFFLVSIGLFLELDVFRSGSTLALAMAVLGAAVASKLVGCAAGAWRLGRADALRVGVGMIPRGEVGLVVAQLGASLGVVPREVYGVVVFMALMTTVVAPPLLNLAYRGVARGPRIREAQIG